jgi:hypothetical protein
MSNDLRACLIGLILGAAVGYCYGIKGQHPTEPQSGINAPVAGGPMPGESLNNTPFVLPAPLPPKSVPDETSSKVGPMGPSIGPTLLPPGAMPRRPAPILDK